MTETTIRVDDHRLSAILARRRLSADSVLLQPVKYHSATEATSISCCLHVYNRIRDPQFFS